MTANLLEEKQLSVGKPGLPLDGGGRVAERLHQRPDSLERGGYDRLAHATGMMNRAKVCSRGILHGRSIAASGVRDKPGGQTWLPDHEVGAANPTD